MNKTPYGKHVIIDTDYPDSVAICDRSGQIFNYEDMVKQMEYRGTKLVWTGLMVGKDYADAPNPQLMPPILPPDPVALMNARPAVGYDWYANTMNSPAADIQTPSNAIGSLFNGNPVLTIAQRQQQLETTWFGGGA